MNDINLFTDILGDEIANSQESQPFSISSENSQLDNHVVNNSEACVPRAIETKNISRPAKGTGQYGQFRSVDEIDIKYRSVFSYPFFNIVQSSVIEDALYSDKSMVLCAPTGSGKTMVFEMAIVQLLMELEDKQYSYDFKIIYMAPVKALCTERLTEWYPKFTKLGLMCIEVTGDTDVDFSQLKPYRIIITTPEKWDMVTRRWREHSQLVEVIKLFLIDEVHILNDEARGPVLEAVVSRMKTIESSAQSAHRIQQLQKQYHGTETTCKESPPKIRFVAVSATVSNPDDVAAWLGNTEKPAVYYKFGDESRPVKLKRIVEGYACPQGTSIFKFDIILNYKLWSVIQKYHNGKPTLIFCNTRKSVMLTAETLSRELTVSFSPEQKAKLTAIASTIKNKKLQMLVLSGVGCHHAGLLYEERTNIEHAFRNRDLPILITTTTLAMGVNLPAHLVIIKNTQQYVNGAYQEYSISTILQMVGRAGRPQFDTEATAVIMTRLCDKPRYQALVGGSEPLQSYLHKRLAENLNSEVALGTVCDVAQCVQWVRSTFLSVRAARDPKRYLGLAQAAPQHLIIKKIEELCVIAINGLASSGLITMDEASCIESTEAGRLMSIFYLDLETMKHIMKINGTETLEQLLWIICESHELADMHLRVDERRCLNTLNRNNAAATIRYPMKGKISTRQMKLNCIIQAILGCLNIPDPSLNQEAMKIMRIADRVCKCLVAYVTRPALISQQPKYFTAVLNGLVLAKCVAAHLWENSLYVSKQLKGIGPTFSTLLATAGKVNFMLLEESHPRDLERIMNKGPPAGNILRKQISLLPKYQLTMTPMDEKSVTIQLTLLNQNHLSANMEQLTAGNTHKGYVLVGDSENNLLLLTSFKDKDLISFYDGIITHQITRMHSFEHKIFVHCISASFVGIDAQCEYTFKNLEAVYPSHPTNKDFTRKPVSKQTNITDAFKDRKRKNASENDITQSKEKKKRDNALFEKFKSLKESFGKTSRELKDDLNKSAVLSNKILQEFTQLEKPIIRAEKVSEPPCKRTRTEPPVDNSIPIPPIVDITNISRTEQIDFDEKSEMDDEKINSILIDIENEISGCNKEIDLPRVSLDVNKNAQNMQSPYTARSSSTIIIPARKHVLVNNTYKTLHNTKNQFQKNNRSKYNFIDILNKNLNLSDDEDILVNNEVSGFSDSIKTQIEKYLQHTKNIAKIPDKSLTDLLLVPEDNQKKDKTSEENSKIELKEKDVSLNISVSKVDNEINALHSKGKIDFMEVREEENKTLNEVEAKTIQQMIERDIRDTSEPVTEVMSSNYIIEVPYPDHCLNLNTNITEKPVESLSSPKIYKRLNDDNQYKNNFEISSEKNQNKHSMTLIIPDSNFTCEKTTTTLNTTQFPSKLLQLPYTAQHNTTKENLETQSPIICTNNTLYSRTHVKQNLPELYGSNLGQYTVMPSENGPNYNSIPKSYNQNSNIRKYSYSATKVDVATREDHVTVIRKIKMDVDITEITAQKKRENTRQDMKNSKLDIKQSYTKNSEIKCTHFDELEPYVECKENTTAVTAYIQQDIKEFDKGDRRNYIDNPETKCIDFEVPEPHVEGDKYDTDVMVYSREQNISNSKNGEGCHYIANPDIKSIDFEIIESHKQAEINKKNQVAYYNRNGVYDEMTKKYIQDEFTERNNDKTLVLSKLDTPPSRITSQCKQTGHTTHDSSAEDVDVATDTLNTKNKSPQKEINRIGNILQKYSKILRKDNSTNLSQMHTQPNVTELSSSSNERLEKPKRPFKITEIQNLKTPLSKLQLSETARREILDDTINAIHKGENMIGIRMHNEQGKEFTYKREDTKTPDEKISTSLEPKELWKGFSQTYALNAVHDKAIAKNIEELSKCQLQDADIEELEPRTETDFNIDQSMFNPKLLLQCIGKDESDIVVPPPPEFCDETELALQDDDVMVPMDYKPTRWYNLYDDSSKESIFQNDSDIELTPKKEIETWTLSQNEENNQNFATSLSFNSRQSFTSLNTPRQRSKLFQNVIISRQNKLGQFKYIHKKKL